jgi:hypothetical protein
MIGAVLCLEIGLLVQLSSLKPQSSGERDNILTSEEIDNKIRSLESNLQKRLDEMETKIDSRIMHWAQHYGSHFSSSSSISQLKSDLNKKLDRIEKKLAEEK